jgi:hypothetical protein
MVTTRARTAGSAIPIFVFPYQKYQTPTLRIMFICQKWVSDITREKWVLFLGRGKWVSGYI